MVIVKAYLLKKNLKVLYDLQIYLIEEFEFGIRPFDEIID